MVAARIFLKRRSRWPMMLLVTSSREPDTSKAYHARLMLQSRAQPSTKVLYVAQRKNSCRSVPRSTDAKYFLIVIFCNRYFNFLPSKTKIRKKRKCPYTPEKGQKVRRRAGLLDSRTSDLHVRRRPQVASSRQPSTCRDVEPRELTPHRHTRTTVAPIHATQTLTHHTSRMPFHGPSAAAAIVNYSRS